MNKANPKRDGKEPEAKVPTDLRKALATDPKVKAKWIDLAPIGGRDFFPWVDSAGEQPDAPKRRIEKACSILAAGKRRP